ncbi:patatin-like phospholipase RssA [Paralcaligenes ureilyticus]|uniref:NTE family protein n=1 Tax=Paralcaligenes ureilyticus TaxID=627131 RepID=A0A4R3MDI0_9BURK|nr:patatin-like phospholipase RssA [Paralcaligenes ureilyticus]TCT10127.1 NTE family protein [Paralcaligenes ureilyticus]
MVKLNSRPSIGLALGGGAARGWAHIGVILALEEYGIRPDIVCGTSIGALVGAVYSVGKIDRFKEWAVGLTIKNVISFMDIALNGGMLKGERLMEFFRQDFIDCSIEDLKVPFGAVATALHTGAEVWLRSGPTLDAIRASIALPGLFSPVWHAGQLLVDGGLVNPVPVSLARAMGADILIAVDLSSDTLARHLVRDSAAAAQADSPGYEWVRKMRSGFGSLLSDEDKNEQRLPRMLDVVASSLNIMQVRITRSRMAGEPPDIIITPKLAHFGLLDFHQAQEAIEAGRRSVESCLPALKGLELSGF